MRGVVTSWALIAAVVCLPAAMSAAPGDGGGSLAPPRALPTVTGLAPRASGTSGCTLWQQFRPYEFGPWPPADVIWADLGDGGTWYAGGNFAAVGALAHRGVVKFDGSQWVGLGPDDPEGRKIDALARFNGPTGPILVAAGMFLSIGGIPANYIAYWKDGSWHPFGTGADERIYDLLVRQEGGQDVLYAVGWFQTIDGVSAPKFARWDGSTWQAVPPPAGIKALAEWGGRICAGGDRRVQCWDGSSWETLGAWTWDTFRVADLAAFDPGGGERLYAAGTFSLSGYTTGGVVVWNGSSWSGPVVGGSVWRLAVADLGSGYELVGAGKVTWPVAGSLVGYDGTSWHVVGAPTVDDGLSGVASGPGRIAVWGRIGRAGAIDVGRFAVWDGTSWSGGWSGTGQGLGPHAHALAVDDDGTGASVVALGSFAGGGAVISPGIVRLVNGQWQAEAPAGLFTSVRALARFGGQAYVAAAVPKAGGGSTGKVFRHANGSWEDVTPAVSSGATFWALAVYDDGSGPALYLGGDFQLSGDPEGAGVARYDGASWTSVGGGLSGSRPTVNVFEVVNGRLCLGGYFSSAGGVPAGNVACWDGSSWDTLGGGTDGMVYALAGRPRNGGNELYIGGLFTHAGGAGADNVAYWDGTSWHPLGAGVDGITSALEVADLGEGERLFVGGTFTSAGGLDVPYLAVWDGGSWAPFPGGQPDYYVYDIVSDDRLQPPGLYILGSFFNIGSTISHGFAVYGCGCSFTDTLVGGEWRLVGLPCAPAPVTLADTFGDDLGTSGYGTTWGVYAWDPAQGGYRWLELDDAMDQRHGYWIKTLSGDVTIGVDGRPSRTGCDPSSQYASEGCFDIAISGTPGGTQHLLPDPYGFGVSWADVRIVDAGGDEWSPSEAEQRGLASKTFYTWNGTAYQAWDDVTPGMVGTLPLFGGYWVKTYADVTLRIPNRPGQGRPESIAQPEADGWFVRLTVSDGAKSDPGNVLGRLPDARKALDPHDLPELEPPADADYLTLVFSPPGWDGTGWGYTSDFRPLRAGASLGRAADRWRFGVRSARPRERVTLRWEGPAQVLRASRLVDLETGNVISPSPGGAYSFDLQDRVRGFIWETRRLPAPASGGPGGGGRP